MGLGAKLNGALLEFEEMTEGILGSCVIHSKQALMMAEASNHFDRGVIQAMGERFMRVAREIVALLIPDAQLKSITLEEENHYIYVRQVNSEYHVVVITNRTEVAGLREMNIKSLIKKLNKVL